MYAALITIMTKDQTGPGGYYHMLCTYIPCNFLLVKGQRAPFVGQQLQVFGASFSQRGHDGSLQVLPSLPWSRLPSN